MLINFATSGGGEHLAGRFIGVTPNLCPPNEFLFPRDREIEKWIADVGYKGRWLALDDDPDLFAQRGGLYLIDGETGLTETDIDAILDFYAASFGDEQ